MFQECQKWFFSLKLASFCRDFAVILAHQRKIYHFFYYIYYYFQTSTGRSGARIHFHVQYGPLIFHLQFYGSYSTPSPKLMGCGDCMRTKNRNTTCNKMDATGFFFELLEIFPIISIGKWAVFAIFEWVIPQMVFSLTLHILLFLAQHQSWSSVSNGFHSFRLGIVIKYY